MLLGCTKSEVDVASAPQTAEDPIDAGEAESPTFDQQIASVRSGDSFTIRVRQPDLNMEQVQTLLEVAGQLRVLEIATTDDQLESFPWTSLEQLRQLVVHGPIADDDLIQIAELLKLEILNLPQGTFSDAGIEALASHSNLQLLRFHSPNVTDASLRSISKMPSLRFLHILNSPVTDEGLETVSEMDQLESFYLDGSHCTEEGLSKLLKEMPELHFHWNETHLETDANKHPH